MSRGKENSPIPSSVGSQLQMDFKRMAIVESPNKFRSFSKSEPQEVQSLSVIENFSNTKIAYISNNSIDKVRSRLRYTGDEKEMLSRLSAFAPGTEIKFDADDGKINLMTGIVAFERSGDKHEIPYGYKLYNLVAVFSPDPAKCGREYATIKEEKYDHPTKTFIMGANFFAQPGDGYLLKKSIKDINGFSRKK
jgi:hypothetical protein